MSIMSDGVGMGRGIIRWKTGCSPTSTIRFTET
jgi:hypothetical protein